MTLHRREIKKADYNPRKISEHARKKLKDKIKAGGLVEALVWNRRTGNLVGGHQRISIMDDLERGTDYLLTVCAIDVDERAERELNLFLNNQTTQGDWDTEALEKIIKDLDGQIEGTGFDKIELQALCDSAEMAGLFSDEKDRAAATVNDLQKIKERRAAAKDKNQSLDDCEFYAVLVFEDRAKLDKFMDRCQLPKETRYHDGRKVEAMLK